MSAVDNISRPSQFNERFTICLDAAGQPVQRTLREMDAAAVMTAIEWNLSEAERLNRLTKPARKLSKAIETGDVTRLVGVTKAEINQAVASLRAAGEAEKTCARLIALVHITIPQWGTHDGMGLRQAVYKFWPRPTR